MPASESLGSVDEVLDDEATVCTLVSYEVIRGHMYVNKIEPYLLLSYQDMLEYMVKPALICNCKRNKM
jgi:hypothetical protein